MYLLFLPLSFLIPSIVRPRHGRDADHGAAGAVRRRARATWSSPRTRARNGLVNLVTPTSAVVMGGLAIARVGYGTWLKFVWPLLILLAILSILVLAVGVVAA